MRANSRLHRSSLVPVLVLLAAAGAAPAAPIAAQESTPRWTVRVYGLGLYPSGDAAQNEIPEGTATFDVSGGTGFGLDLEYLVTPRIGVEAAILAGDYEADFSLDTGIERLSDTEDLATQIFTLGANYHFTPGGRTDLFAGVLVAMSTFEGVTFLTEQGMRAKRPFDDDIGFGIKAGIVVPFGSTNRWSFNAQIRYLVTILEAESDSGGRDVDLDPFIPSLGLGYRF